MDYHQHKTEDDSDGITIRRDFNFWEEENYRPQSKVRC